jgi:DNA-binding CsgD family transcriptional regulator
MLGRQPERHRIDTLVDRARDGNGWSLVVSGEAGIGKSTLLRYAESRASGFTVLRATGMESESELPFSGLADLLRPLLNELAALPEPQAVALRSALAIGPPVPGDPLAIAIATLGLLSKAAETAPLISLIEDAQWLDQASLGVLLFVARRLQAEGVLMIFAVREGETSALSLEGLETLRLTGIDETAATALIEQAAHGLSPLAAAKIRDVAAGNPLALLEIPLTLTEAQRRGTEALEEPLSAGPGLMAIYKRRTELLSPEAQAGLLIAAASDRDDLGPVLRAMSGTGLQPRALEEAETAGFLTFRVDQLTWRHPLVRAAVYHGAAPAARRAAHRALAEALDARRAPDSRAWHFAAAALGHDEVAAAALERSAVSARLRRGNAAAARAFERAARLSADPEARARRLYEAGLDLLSTVQPDRATQLLAEALSLTEDAGCRCDIVRARAMADMFRGSPEENIDNLVKEADNIEPLDPRRAAILRSDACVASTMTGNVGKALLLAERALQAARIAGPQAAALSESMLANALILAGRVREARPYLEAGWEVFRRDGLPPVPFRLHVVQSLGHTATWLENYDKARRFLNDVVSSARDQGAVAGLTFPLSCLSEVEYRTGRWASAYALAAESERISEVVGGRNELSFSLVCLARVEAGIGREDDCRAHLTEAAAISRELAIGSIEVYVRATSGLLELGLGHPDRALVHLEPLSRLVERFQLGHPNVVQWGSDFVESLARSGDTDGAQKALATFELLGRASDSHWALGEAARCHGLLADDDGFEAHFAEALGWLDEDDAVFERARTMLCLGERRRRARRVGEARDALVSALAGFEQLGAQCWILRTRRELSATGARLGPAPEPAVQQLTPQELQVALAAAAGATNREIAANLFLSPKTVDFHLGKVYRKLEVRSRSQLAALMTRKAGG